MTTNPTFAEVLADLGLTDDDVPSLVALTATDQAALAARITESMVLQEAALNRASDEALGHLPRLMRGPVRKILGGS